MDELILHSERHNFRGSFDTDDWGALASHTLRQVLLKTWIMARYREAAATAGLPIIPFPQKRPHIHIVSCHRKFIVISPLQQFVSGDRAHLTNKLNPL